MTELATSAFIVGLLGGVHCVAMCGGIVGALNLHGRHGDSVRLGSGGAAVAGAVGLAMQAPIHLAYSAGRVASYAVAGAIAGGVGGTAAMLETVLPAQVALAVVANGLVVLLGLYLAGLGRAVAGLERWGTALWRRVSQLGGRFLPADTVPRALGMGAVWGWLPCGLVYSVLALALLSGSATRGALVMLAFGLGTVPNVLAAGLAVGALRSSLRRRGVRLAAGLAVVALGIFGALRTPGLIEHVRQGIACLA
ncbi:MAG TPA: sulfite exporter TauE/SafE family protein [Burkholderiales bacterium]|nr:sulfite exporter TauE/SafE family protein [Burkholderiales bacterium]